MATAEDFAPGDWALLRELPFKVILAAVVTDVGGGRGTASKEILVAAKRLVADATSNFGSNELISSVLGDLQASASDDLEVDFNDVEARRAAIIEGIALSERASGVLEGMDGGTEAVEYKQWVLNAALTVVNATSSGGFLGFGADRISKQERDFLDQLRAALGIAAAEG